MIQRERIISELIELVKISSETGFERNICDHLIERFRSLQLQAVEDDTHSVTGHEAGNIIITMDATEGMEQVPTLMFTVHMDTVVPGQNIQPRIDDDGYIRSDGTTILGSDDKAGIAAIIEAIQVIQENGIPHGRIQIIITAGEEAGLVGAKAFDPERLQADYGFALDSNGKVGEIAVAAPYQASIDVTVYGKSAHAGVNPEDGVSAIQIASKAISSMPLGRIDEETTANIGSFQGLGPTNIVCDRVTIQAEARSIRQEKLDHQLHLMRQSFEEAAEQLGGRVEMNHSITPGFLFDEQTPVVQLAFRAIEQIGRKPHTFHSGGGSDANIFNGMGVPTVNLAIGYEHIHTKQEQMPIEELVKAAELVVAIVQQAVHER